MRLSTAKDGYETSLMTQVLIVDDRERRLPTIVVSRPCNKRGFASARLPAQLRSHTLGQDRTPEVLRSSVLRLQAAGQIPRLVGSTRPPRWLIRRTIRRPLSSRHGNISATKWQLRVASCTSWQAEFKGRSIEIPKDRVDVYIFNESVGPPCY